MSFPGTMNINYYRGDTYEFKLYPKDSAGGTFSLAGYDRTTGSKFTISTVRGIDGVATAIEAYSEISPNYDYILCAIRPADAVDMTDGLSYVYDIEISKTGTPYPMTITMLTGTITVTEQVTGAVE